MIHHLRFALAATAMLVGACLAHASLAAPPDDIAAQLRALGPVINPPAVMKIYGPLLAKQDKSGVKRTDDLAYGADERNKLDLFAPEQAAAQPMPILIFVHGGAFAHGDRKQRDNVGYYFARRGILTLVISYRLAPKDHWPAGAEDVGRAISWAHANTAKFGGDPKRIFLMGESAGGAHIATYAFMKRLNHGNPGIAGTILISGAYDFALEHQAAKAIGAPEVDAINGVYFGTDFARYPEMSPVLHLDGHNAPIFLSYADLDPAQMQMEAGELFAALCRHDHVCPVLNRVTGHDHISQIASINTGDETLSAPVLAFIRAH
ncbi:MAG TPA: alpha/beta hydrolase [Magnetospirillaceae bacterium]